MKIVDPMFVVAALMLLGYAVRESKRSPWFWSVVRGLFVVGIALMGLGRP